MPGVKYHVVRGTLDCGGVEGRRKARSRYGAKTPKKSQVTAAAASAAAATPEEKVEEKPEEKVEEKPEEKPQAGD